MRARSAPSPPCSVSTSFYERGSDPDSWFRHGVHMPRAWPTHGLAAASSCFDGARWRGETVRSDVPTQSPTVFIFHHALPRRGTLLHHTRDASRPLLVRRSSLISPPCWRSPFDLRSCHEPYLRTTACCVCPRPICEASQCASEARRVTFTMAHARSQPFGCARLWACSGVV